MKGRDPMKGRHAVGVQRVSTGKQRAGQSEPASNKAITGVSPSSPSRMMQPKPGVLANQAKTSADLQSRLAGKAPQPFTNTQGGATLPAQSGAAGAKPGLEPRIRAGLSGATVGAKALPQARAVGYQGGTAPTSGNNQVISGRFAKPLARKRGDNAPGYPSKRNASFYGE